MACCGQELRPAFVMDILYTHTHYLHTIYATNIHHLFARSILWTNFLLDNTQLLWKFAMKSHRSCVFSVFYFSVIRHTFSHRGSHHILSHLV